MRWVEESVVKVCKVQAAMTGMTGTSCLMDDRAGPSKRAQSSAHIEQPTRT